MLSGWYSGRSVGSGRYTDELVAALRFGAGPEERFELAEPSRARSTAFKLVFEQAVFPWQSRTADVAHVPYWAPPLVAAAPTVITVHDLIPLVLPEYRPGAKHRAYVDLVARASHGAAAVVTDSEHTARDIRSHLGLADELVQVVPLGVDPRFCPAGGESRHRQSEGELRHHQSEGEPPLRQTGGEQAPDRSRPVAASPLAGFDLPGRFGLYLGGFDRRKNLEVLLAAWRGVDRAIGLPLVIAGDLPQSDSSTKLHPAPAAHHVGLPDEAVRLIGHVPTPALPNLYRRASVFVYPSRYEGFGLPPLEALACGVPVVAADATSLPEVVGDAGLLVDPDDVDGWTDAVCRAVEDDELAQRLRSAGPRRAAQFTWGRTAAMTREVYESVRRA